MDISKGHISTKSTDNSEGSDEDSGDRLSASGGKKKQQFRPANDNETVDACPSNWQGALPNAANGPAAAPPPPPPPPAPNQLQQQAPANPFQGDKPAKDPAYVFDQNAFFALPAQKGAAKKGGSGKTPKAKTPQKKKSKKNPNPKGLEPYFCVPTPK